MTNFNVHIILVSNDIEMCEAGINEDIDQVVEWCVMNIGGLSSMYQSEINVSCIISYINYMKTKINMLSHNFF